MVYWYSFPHFNQLFASWQWFFIILYYVSFYLTKSEYIWFQGKIWMGWKTRSRRLQLESAPGDQPAIWFADGNQVIFIWDAVVEGSWDQCSQYRHHVWLRWRKGNWQWTMMHCFNKCSCMAPLHVMPWRNVLSSKNKNSSKISEAVCDCVCRNAIMQCGTR